MNNLVKNELSKIFHKKTIYVMLISILVIMILSEIMDKIFKYENILVSDIEYNEEQANSLDKTDSEGKIEYYNMKTNAECGKLIKKYGVNSWQAYYAQNLGRDIIYNMYVAEGTEIYENAKNEYDKLILKFDNNDWKSFAEEELEKINMQIEQMQNLDNTDNLTLETLKVEKQVLEWRLEKNIPYGNTNKNTMLDMWKNAKIDIYSTDEEAKIKELDYETKWRYQFWQGLQGLTEYAIQNNLDEKMMISDINSYSTEAIATENDFVLLDIFSGYEFFIVIIVAVIAGAIVSEEFNKGTIKLLLVRPYKRTKILMAKFLTSIIILILTILFILVMQYLVTGLFKGFGNYTWKMMVYNYNRNQVCEVTLLGQIILTCITVLPKTFLLMTLAFAVSTIFMSSSLGVAFPLLGYIGGEIINEIAYNNEKARFLKFFVTPNWNWSIFLRGRLPEFNAVNLVFSITICIIYFIIMLAVSMGIFNKKDIKNI